MLSEGRVLSRLGIRPTVSTRESVLLDLGLTGKGKRPSAPRDRVLLDLGLLVGEGMGWPIPSRDTRRTGCGSDAKNTVPWRDMLASRALPARRLALLGETGSEGSSAVPSRTNSELKCGELRCRELVFIACELPGR